MKEISAGGIVLHDEKVLLLKKYNGAWVLPKGRVESGEKLSETALREVLEESNVDASLGTYIDYIEYSYYSYSRMRKIEKTVHWFLMHSQDTSCAPLKKEGFVKATYVDVDKAKTLLSHRNELNVFLKALRMKESVME